MEYRTYKDTDQRVSLLGFGLMRLPMIDEKPQCIDTVKARQMVDYALAHGVNYFDTAYPYHMGNSESFVGEALAGYPRDHYFLASKMPLFSLTRKEDVDRIFQEQLNKCRTTYFDFYLLHSVTTEHMDVMEKFDVYAYLREKKAQGVIRRLGFSFHDSTEVLRRLVEQYDFDFGQLQLNYLDWEMQDAKGQYEVLTERGIPVIVMEPVRGGTLASLCEGAREVFRSANPQASVASWALRYAASLPNVLCLLSGMTTMEQLQDNVATLSGFQPLLQKDYEVIERALLAYRVAAPVPCTACGYCMECPSGVDISRVFSLYNEWRLSGNEIGYRIGLDQLGETKHARHCTECGQCLALCPQKISIPERMREIATSL